MARYPVVTLDVGRTLVGPRDGYGAVYSRVLGRLGVTVEVEALDRGIAGAAADVARKVPVGADRFAHFGDGEHGFWTRFVGDVFRRAVGSEPAEDLIRRAVVELRGAFAERSAWRVYDDVVPACEQLTAAGIRLAVVSNWDSRLLQVLELCGLRRFFSAVGCSRTVGFEKPDPRLFRRVLARLGAAPATALHVGDVVELDIAGARAAGIDAVLIDRTGDRSAAARAIRSLEELVAITRNGL